ncbi:restriction endonuclease [Mycobacterium kansasii]
MTRALCPRRRRTFAVPWVNVCSRHAETIQRVSASSGDADHAQEWRRDRARISRSDGDCLARTPRGRRHSLREGRWPSERRFIECRDWKRPQNVQWVEQARTKFDDLGANVKILVSSSGFTKTALAKAARLGIKTITTGEVTPEFVGKVVNSADSAEYWHWVTLVQQAIVVITRDGLTQQQELPGNVPVLYPDGSEASMFEDLVNHVMRQHTWAHDHGTCQTI